MKIRTFSDDPICEIPFLNAGKGVGAFYVDRLPIHVGELDSLPNELDAIIATADLQGREQFVEAQGNPPRLLGEVLPDKLVHDVLPDLRLSPERTGVVLAGDFYTVPNLDRRGGSGDVHAVWRAFANRFKWIVGVAGNHDLYGDSLAPSRAIASNAYYLDGDHVVVDGLTVAGLGGIIGNPRKPQRKTDQDFANQLVELLLEEPDIVVMHDGPDDVDRAQKGSPIVRHTIESAEATMVIRGHAHWIQPMAQLANGTQVLNVDCRVAILTR